MQELHFVQTQILCALLTKKSVRFTDLNIKGLTSDHFSYHLRQLIKDKLVEKKGYRYLLTTKGKKYSGMLDTQNLKIEEQAKVSVVVVGVRTVNGEKEILVQKRLKHPYWGYHGLITGKIRRGETTEESANRELKEEAGLRGKCEIASIMHKMDYSCDGELLEDKFFFRYKVENPKGKLKKKFEEGEFFWVSVKNIKNLSKLFPDMVQIVNDVVNNKFSYSEKKFIVKEF